MPGQEFAALTAAEDEHFITFRLGHLYLLVVQDGSWFRMALQPSSCPALSREVGSSCRGSHGAILTVGLEVGAR
jgi:hypothetical protein